MVNLPQLSLRSREGIGVIPQPGSQVVSEEQGEVRILGLTSQGAIRRSGLYNNRFGLVDAQWQVPYVLSVH